MPATTGMKGRVLRPHSRAQVLDQAFQGWVETSCNAPLPPPGQPVTVLDLGSSEGGNDVRLLGAVVAGLRHAPAGPCRRSTVTCPATTSTGCSPTWSRPAVPASSMRGVYSAALGGSFYGPLLPPGTSTLPPASTPFIGSTGGPRCPCPMGCLPPAPPAPAGSGGVTGGLPGVHRAGGPGPGPVPGMPWAGMVPEGKLLLAGPGDTERPSSPTASRSSSTTPASTWSPPAGCSESI